MTEPLTRFLRRFGTFRGDRSLTATHCTTGNSAMGHACRMVSTGLCVRPPSRYPAARCYEKFNCIVIRCGVETRTLIAIYVSSTRKTTFGTLPLKDTAPAANTTHWGLQPGSTMSFRMRREFNVCHSMLFNQGRAGGAPHDPKTRKLE